MILGVINWTLTKWNKFRVLQVFLALLNEILQITYFLSIKHLILTLRSENIFWTIFEETTVIFSIWITSNPRFLRVKWLKMRIKTFKFERSICLKLCKILILHFQKTFCSQSLKICKLTHQMFLQKPFFLIRS